MSNSVADQRPTNRLAHESSPYLLQHARNPVDWYPWGPEALERARRENKPIFLSIGYSACHWCHVMEHESFENPAIAALMNEHFINIKVDREERPDLDDIYMKAVQAISGSGGWPMSVFLTPELEPFFGGTYFPPVRRYNRPSFPEVVVSLGNAWVKDRESIVKRGKALADMIRADGGAKAVAELNANALDASLAMLGQNYDPQWGGFGDAPKFPHAMDLRIVLRHALRTNSDGARAMVTHTLDKMAAGGMYDQLGGGFHRYSTDEKWLIPHFEKMLYDNALLVPAYLEGYLATGNSEYARIARECCEWVLREMVTAEGAFASTQDADSEGEEGKFFAWTPAELTAVLGARDGAWAAAWWGVTDEGNFEHGKSALWRPEPAADVAKALRVDESTLRAAMEAARGKLWTAREQRVHPGKDDKVLASWNGLMISGLAQSYQVLGDERYLAAARGAANYVLEGMRQSDGALLATARHGKAKLNAYLDDYAFVIQGLIDLYESDFDPRWIHEALALNRVLDERFWDSENGGWFTTGSNHEQLIARLKSPHDGALPAGGSVQALNLLRLAELTGRGSLAQRAEAAIKSVGALANRYPAAFSQLFIAVDFLAASPRELVVAGELSDARTQDFLRTIRGRFAPQRVVALADARADRETMPVLDGKSAGAAGPRVYVCRNYACQRPAESLAELAEHLDD
ncbi:MAG: thioredoxin domain-containing protein [Planctomycetes bacterium]|nr:thioredoxin domain-containing protein [Planctomycetota bacterium]